MESDWLERAIVAGVVVVVAIGVARFVDRALVRRLELRPETLTRYRVLRRSAMATIIAIGVLSALLVIPQFRAVTGAILASSAVIALVVGFAAQATLSNFIAGILVAFTQPVRLGDHIEVSGAGGTVEEIGLTYTLLRAPDGSRFFVPNVKLASDTIRNTTLSSAEHLAQVDVAVPVRADLDRVRDLISEEARAAHAAMTDREPTASVSRLESSQAVVTVEAWAPSAADAARVAADIRLAVQRRLRDEGVYA
jgi:moderate conductance mechanosensitive channel